jgi:putative ABC transport system permease protein
MRLIFDLLNRGPGMGLANLAHYAFSDLRHRRASTLLNVAAVALSAAYLFVLGFYGNAIYRYQCAVFAENLPTKIDVTTPEVTDRRRRFTDERLAEVARLPGVLMALPHVELNVRLALGAGPAIDVPAEGTVPGDPSLAPARLGWGDGVTADDGREIVLSQSLFEKLGGVVADRARPDAVTLQIGRTVAGHEEVQRLRLRVVGLLRHQASDRVYVPVRMAALLDLWCTNKVASVSGEGGRPAACAITYPFCHAYAPAAEVDRVQAEAENLRVTVRRTGEVKVPDEVGEPRRLVRFEVRDPRGPDGRVSEELVASLALSRPTFVAAVPFLSVAGSFGESARSVEVVGSEASDPARFGVAAVAGTWLTGDSKIGVVVPRSAVRGQPPGGVVGRKTMLHFRRDLPDGRQAALSLPVEVVGVVDGERAYVPMRLAANVFLWQRGRLVFNDTRLEFEAPAETAVRAGHVRCTVFARDAESVAPVVRALQRQGYRTDDRLADQEGLQRLGCVLVAVVGFFAFGCVVNAAITVLITTMMNIRSKTWEIGILRAHGVHGGDVVTLFACQGVLIGSAAFAVGAAAVAVVEPLLRGLVCQAFSWKPGTVLTGSPFQASLWWLSATVLAVSVGFALAGVLVPAALACRLSPVEAFRRRE